MINNSLFRVIFDISKNLDLLQERKDFCFAPDFSTITISDFDAHNIFEYINQFECELKFFIKTSDQQQTRLALDSLLTIKTKNQEELLAQIISKNPNLTWYGANRFNTKEGQDNHWNGLLDFLYFIPKIELQSENSKSVLKINIDSKILREPTLLAEYFFDLLNSIQSQVRLTSSTNTSTNHIVNTYERPSFHEWEKMITLAHEQSHSLKKVILSRREEIFFKNNIDQSALAQELYETRLDNSYFIYFKFSNDSTFISVTPETLFKSKNNQVTIDSIAGTSSRSTNPEEDRELARSLLNNPKEVNEHEIVTENILSLLKNVTDSAKVEFEKEILKLKHVQHIHTKITAKIQSTDSQRLLELLHPTAAIGGEPKDEALDFILKHEDRPRGLYAAPIGFISTNETVFAVGIRSCLVKNENIQLFGGCGIVKESLAHNEWFETKIKMNNFRGILENIIF